MNKKVFTTMLSLSVVFLVLCYFLKIFFPQEFVMAVENERILIIGKYIDTHKWANFIFGFVIGFIFDWFYFGAVTKKLVPSPILLAIMVIYGLSLNAYYSFASIEIMTNFSSIIVAISSCYMILTPMFFTKTIKELSITYSANFISQTLLLIIRNLTSTMANTNAISSLIWGIDNYIWIALCYIIFNYKTNKKEIY